MMNVILYFDNGHLLYQHYNTLLYHKATAMNNLFQTDDLRVQLYKNENAGWLKIINTHADEIPVMEKMLADNDAIIFSNKSREKLHFKNELLEQQVQMQQLNAELGAQQQRLETDSAKKSLYDINALCSQDILRDRIKEVEKKYIELKCNFMKFLSGII